MKILIAEDDPVSKRVLQKSLEKWGHTVYTAQNGEEALAVIKQQDIKLVIADWLMPVLDGLELCAKIRSLKDIGYIYIILLTSKDTKEDTIKGLDAGADDYVVKPFVWEEIKVRLRNGERILDLEKKLTATNEKLIDLNIKLEKLACKDPLTSIGNRRYLHDVMDKAHHRACRYEQRYGIIMCDIDFFKKYNDHYGHLAGDRALKEVASAIQNVLRTSDDLFRYGGEEILVLLPDQSEESTLLAAERVRTAVESLGIAHAGSDIGIVTISCGVAAFDGECEDIKWAATLDRADKAMYRAKSEGRNKVSK